MSAVRSRGDIATSIRNAGTSVRGITEFYDNWAEKYEKEISSLCYSSHKMAVNCLLANYRGERESAKVLDVACGTGLVAYQLNQHGFKDFTGLDASEAMLGEARKKGIYRRLSVCALGREQLLFNDGSFDVVIIAGGLGLGFGPVSAVRELCSAAKPGGYVVLSVGSHGNDEGYKETLERELELLEDEGLWSRVDVHQSIAYMRDPSQPDRFIGGTAYLFQTSTQAPADGS